jgi:hypothetical protein
VIFDIQFEEARSDAKTHPRMFRPGVPRDIVQRFLHDAVDVNQIEARHDDGGERRGQKHVDLSLNLGVDALHPPGRLFLAFVVFDE